MANGGGGDGMGLGGGILNRGTLEVSNSTLYRNSARPAAAYSTAYLARLRSRTRSLLTALQLRARIVWGPSPTAATTSTRTLPAASGTNNFSLSGVDPMLGPLADKGGPTKTHALLAGSPAIDQGNSFGESTDQRGLPRPSDFVGIPDATEGDGSDIGAFELQAPPTPPDTTPPKVTSTVPGNGGEVGPAVNVRATFSEDMLVSSITGQTFKLYKKGSTTQIAATVSYNADTYTATLDPTNNLRRGLTYKAVVTTGAKDVAGKRLDQDTKTTGLQQKVWYFTIDD